MKLRYLIPLVIIAFIVLARMLNWADGWQFEQKPAQHLSCVPKGVHVPGYGIHKANGVTCGYQTPQR